MSLKPDFLTNKKRSGAASTEEKSYIYEHMGTDSITEIAHHINRTPAFVKKCIKEFPSYKVAINNTPILEALHGAAFWLEVLRQLLHSEIKYFEQQWILYINQFSTNTILATDELMIRDLIMLDIMANRAGAEKVKAINAIQKVETSLEKEMKLPPDQRDMLVVDNLTRRLSELRASFEALSREYLNYQGKKDDKLKDLKATRDKRFKSLEESKRNIFELIKELNERKRREEDGRMIEKYRAGAEKIKQDWTELMQFDDEGYDKTLLIPEDE